MYSTAYTHLYRLYQYILNVSITVIQVNANTHLVSSNNHKLLLYYVVKL